MLASASEQSRYEKAVPNSFVAAELIEHFATDLYHPKSHDFIGAFNETELKDLAHLFGLVCEAAKKMNETEVHSVADLQKLPEWRRVMSLAKSLQETFRRI